MPKGLILVVDDHADTNLSLQFLLRRAGYEVLGATNIAEALGIAESNPIDLLISDIGLPDGTGWEMMNRLGAKRPPMAIALSGFGTEGDIQRSKEAGFDRHLTKPYNVAILKREVAALIEAV
jgi:CheY-like chemotaxis protein